MGVVWLDREGVRAVTRRAEWTAALGDDLPPNARVDRIDKRPQYKWTCSKCGVSRRFYHLESAIDQAWTHDDEFCSTESQMPPVPGQGKLRWN